MQGQANNLGELARLFTRLGFTAFGGPAAHIAMMHDEVVVRRRWMDEQSFLDMVGATNLIPGPNSTEMAIHIGHMRGGWRGLLLAGACFILPAVLIVIGLAWVYTTYGQTVEGEAIFYGIKPIIIAIVLQALFRLGQTALKNRLLTAVSLATFVLYLLGINELLLLFGGGLLVLAATLIQRNRTAGLNSLPTLLPLLATGAFVRLATETAAVRLDQLFLIFLKIGAVLYGSGYVLLAFLRNDFVVRLGWLTEQQLLDAIAIGQFTPGPVFTTATFIGYVLAGVPGALVATVGIFLPAFCFVALLSRILPYLRRSVWTAAILDGVNATSLGLMAGVTWQLGRATLSNGLAWLLVLGALFLLFRFKLNSVWLIVAGGLIGLLAQSVTRF